jgi:exopolysaccharide biosynthesis polyprenyl glycosylphosphotransferase
MLRRYSVNFELFSILLDAVCIVTALSLANVAHPWLEMLVSFIKQAGEHELSTVYYIVFPAIWVYINLGLLIYDGRRNYRFLDEVYRLMLGILLATVSLAGLFFFTSLDFAQSVFITFILIAGILMMSWRVAVRSFWRLQYSNKKELRRVLIVGAGDTGREMASRFSFPPESNLEIIGFLDDDPGKSAQNHDVLGTINDLERIVSFYHVNILLIALPPSAFTITSNIVDKLHMNPVKIWIVPNTYRLARFQCRVEYMSNIPLIDVRAPSISENQRLIKRLFDLIFASIAIVLCAPLMIIVAVLIKFDSPGPIFFRQKRVGENTQPFEILKFRTMAHDAEALSASVEKVDGQGNILHKHRNDPRITRIGHFLRHYSIDELPQLFNVLLGKMSIVGPRPELPCLVEKYKSWQYTRFTIPQGITGWWQITGRSDKPMHLNTEDDLYYIKNYSIWLDIKILCRTFVTVISGRGAY